MTTKITLNELRTIIKEIIKEEKSHQKKLLNIGDEIIVNNVSNLPKGYENLKKGDKITIAKIWRNANDSTILYAADNNNYGLSNDDINNLK
jgi:rubrerythrin